jgi:ParB-like chromosome segregation protein Spo0J
MSQIEVLEPPTVAVRIKVADLKVGPSFREGGLCPEHVERLMTLGGSWPPIVVDSDGLVIDGAHRVIAARRLGWARLDAVLFEGGSEEAFIEFVRRNVAHGLLLTLRERKRAAVRVLGSHREWSDRRVAEVCGISSKTVGRLRLDAGCPTEEDAQLDGGSRVGRDDRRRPVQRGSARARVVEALQTQPSGSLRAVAAVAGVSPETVRLVRMNLTQAPQPADAVAETAAGDESVAWRADAALASCDAGQEFLAWFERTQIADADMARVHAVPISRIYDVAKEARRRSEGWLDLARALEARTRIN